MKIGIIGSGNVGSNLGIALAAKGHQVMFGKRDPHDEKTVALLHKIGANAQAGSVAEAIAFGEAIAITSPWNAIDDVVSVGDWTGKIVMDAMNRFGQFPTSAAEELAAKLPQAHIVKAFNTIGAEHLVNPVVNGQTATMFIAGDDVHAKQLVGQLVMDLGFDLVDAGALSQARLVEKLAELWVSLMRGGMGRNIAFKLLQGE